MASMTRRITVRLAGGCALLLGMSLSGCTAPLQPSGVVDPGMNIHFWVPSDWHQVNGASLLTAMKTAGLIGTPTWKVAYEADPNPTATDFLSFAAAQPFVAAWSSSVPAATSSEITDDALRDFILPVTPKERQSDVGFPATGFRQIRDQVLTLSQGVHGVRETYDYTLVVNTDTFDSEMLTDAPQNAVFVLVVHCITACYGKYRTQIEHIMSSVTVSGSYAGDRTGRPISPATTVSRLS